MRAVATKDMGHALVRVQEEGEEQVVGEKEDIDNKQLYLQAHGKVRAVATKDVGHALVRVQEEEDAHFIVMGSRGKGTLRRTFMGSVSDYVVHHASVPVLVCRCVNKYFNVCLPFLSDIRGVLHFHGLMR